MMHPQLRNIPSGARPRRRSEPVQTAVPILVLVFAGLLFPISAWGQATVLDDFATLDQWTVIA